MKRYVSYYYGERFVGYEAMNADAQYLGGQLDSAFEITLDKMGEAFNVIRLLVEAEDKLSVEISGKYDIDYLFVLAQKAEDSMLEGIMH